jgi:hypothetical protein
MAILQGMCTSFKAEVLLAVHDFRAIGGDTFKIALYTAAADLDANTTAYTPSSEITGTGYIAGGKTLTNLGVTTFNDTSSQGIGYTTFNDVAWTGATFTARGALIYNTTPSALSNTGAILTNPAVAILDFGSDKTVSIGNFTIIFPSATNTTAIVRIA